MLGLPLDKTYEPSADSKRISLKDSSRFEKYINNNVNFESKL